MAMLEVQPFSSDFTSDSLDVEHLKTGAKQFLLSEFSGILDQNGVA